MKLSIFGVDVVLERSTKELSFSAFIEVMYREPEQHDFNANSRMEAIRSSVDIARDLCLLHRCPVKVDLMLWDDDGMLETVKCFTVFFQPQAVVQFY